MHCATIKIILPKLHLVGSLYNINLMVRGNSNINFVMNTLPSYTSISNAAVSNTVQVDFKYLCNLARY